MRAIAQALGRFLNAALRVNQRARYSLAKHGVEQFAVKAARNINFKAGNIRIAYEDFSEEGKEVANEIFKSVVTFTDEYLQNHETYEQQRRDPMDLEETLMSHADEIWSNAVRTYNSRIKSHGYDLLTGRARRESELEPADLLKHYVFAAIHDWSEEVEKHAD